MTKSGKRSRTWIIAGLSVLVLSVIIAAFSQTDKAQRLLDRTPVRSNDIILFGDSHIELFDASGSMNDRRIRNRGYSGETSQALLERTDDITRVGTRRVLLLAGANDAYRGRTRESFIQDMNSLIDILSPHTQEVVVISIPPSVDRSVQKTIDAFNTALQQVCAGRDIRYIDLDPVVKQNGVMDPELTNDGVHFNPEGYNRILPLLKPVLQMKS